MRARFGRAGVRHGVTNRTRVPRPRSGPMGYAMTAPALLIFAVFTIAPTAYTLYISFFNWNSLNASLSKFIGIDNYRALFADASPSFAQTLWNSLYFVAGMVIGGTVVSLAIALLLQRGGRWIGASRLAVFAPNVTPFAATSVVFVWMFNPQFGLANAVLHWVGLPTSDWLQSTTWAMPAILIYSLWHQIGFTVIVIIGGLATISPELSEAAKVDGAGAWKEFWYVTLPQLRGVMTFVVTITTIASLQAFTQFFIMSEGGPVHATTTVSYLLYEEAFVFFKTGYGAAIAIVLFLITAAFTLLQLRLNRTSRSFS